MISSLEKNQIKSIILSPAWGIIELIRKDLIQNIQNQTKLQDTEWETLKTTIFNEGQIAGINKLVQELFNTQQ